MDTAPFALVYAYRLKREYGKASGSSGKVFAGLPVDMKDFECTEKDFANDKNADYIVPWQFEVSQYNLRMQVIGLLIYMIRRSFGFGVIHLAKCHRKEISSVLALYRLPGVLSLLETIISNVEECNTKQDGGDPSLSKRKAYGYVKAGDGLMELDKEDKLATPDDRVTMILDKLVAETHGRKVGSSSSGPKKSTTISGSVANVASTATMKAKPPAKDRNNAAVGHAVPALAASPVIDTIERRNRRVGSQEISQWIIATATLPLKRNPAVLLASNNLIPNHLQRLSKWWIKRKAKDVPPLPTS